MICFRCRRGYKSKKEFGAFYQIKMLNGKGHVDGYWLCPECAKALREWLYGGDANAEG